MAAWPSTGGLGAGLTAPPPTVARRMSIVPLVMSDEELLDALDPDHPGLEAVRQARAAGDPGAARTELVRWFRRRGEGGSGPHGGSEDQPEAVSERGEELCRDLSGRDWLSVPHPEEIPERLHSTQVMGLNDHGEFAALAQEYADTGNHRYARECVARMLEWIEANGPLPDRPPTGPTGAYWRTIFYTLPRTANWTRCLELLRHCPAVTEEELITLVKVILHHLRYAAGNQVPGMPNMIAHLHEQLIGLGEQWPEFAESRGWTRTGLEGLRALLDDYFYPDGAYIELCYFAHESFTRVLQRGERGEIELPPGFREKVEGIFDFPAYMVKPNGSYPSVNDNYSAQDAENLPERRGGLIELGVEITGRPDLRYIESFGADGTPPPWTSRPFPYAGFYVMRSDWSAEARYLVFDGGRSAGGHNHVDKLSFELYAYGNTLVTDSGCAGPWASAWRSEYFVGPAGHNTIMVDGRGQVAGLPLFEIPSLRGRTSWRQIAPDPLPNTWVSGRRFDYAGSRYEDGYATYGSEQSRRRGFAYESKRVDSVERMQPWTQRQGGDLQVPPHQRLFVDHDRRILFVKPDYWILSDRLLGKGRHRAESMFHFQASATARVEPGDGSVRTVNGRAGPGHPARPGAGSWRRASSRVRRSPCRDGSRPAGASTAPRRRPSTRWRRNCPWRWTWCCIPTPGTAPRPWRWSGCRWRKRGTRSPPGRPPPSACTSRDRAGLLPRLPRAPRPAQRGTAGERRRPRAGALRRGGASFAAISDQRQLRQPGGPPPRGRRGDLPAPGTVLGGGCANGGGGPPGGGGPVGGRRPAADHRRGGGGGHSAGG